MEKTKYFHLTPIDNKDSILKNGLQAGADTQIFMFTNLAVASSIAANQVEIPRGEMFVVFEIQADGITSKIINDNVGENTAEFQFYIEQKEIYPQHIRVLYEDILLDDEEIRDWNEEYFAAFDKCVQGEELEEGEGLILVKGIKYRSQADIYLLD